MRTSAVKRLDLAWVEGLRKDFLALLKNLPKVKDYETAHELRDAFRIYRKHFKELMFEHFLNKLNDQLFHMGWSHEMAKSDADGLNRMLRAVAWGFMTELAVPVEFKSSYRSEAASYQYFLQEFPKWKTRVQHKAQVFWKAMKEVIYWFENIQKKPLTVKTPDVEKTVIEGFQFIVRGFEAGDEYDEQGLVLFREGLKLYRRRAAQVAPILLQKQLPVVVEFAKELDKGGTYNRDGTITFWVTSVINKGPDWVAHVMAHEMGHHLWQTVLSGEAQNFWEMTIKGDYGSLDVQEVIDKWPGDAWAFEFSRYLGDSNPVLALQVEALTQSSAYDKVQSKEDFQKLLDSGTKSVRVPKHPITGYANKNPEEAFCEVIGLLVSRGPGAVQDQVKQWFHTALPGAVKLASARTVVAMFLGDALSPCRFSYS